VNSDSFLQILSEAKVLIAKPATNIKVAGTHYTLVSKTIKQIDRLIRGVKSNSEQFHEEISALMAKGGPVHRLTQANGREQEYFRLAKRARKLYHEARSVTPVAFDISTPSYANDSVQEEQTSAPQAITTLDGLRNLLGAMSAAVEQAVKNDEPVTEYVEKSPRERSTSEVKPIPRHEPHEREFVISPLIKEANSPKIRDRDLCLCKISPRYLLEQYSIVGSTDRGLVVEIYRCTHCHQLWLKTTIERKDSKEPERVYLGAISDEEAQNINPHNALLTLEKLPEYYYEGTFYEGRSGKMSGPTGLLA
jgi:hypothetical protein